VFLFPHLRIQRSTTIFRHTVRSPLSLTGPRVYKYTLNWNIIETAGTIFILLHCNLISFRKIQNTMWNSKKRDATPTFPSRLKRELQKVKVSLERSNEFYIPLSSARYSDVHWIFYLPPLEIFKRFLMHHLSIKRNALCCNVTWNIARCQFNLTVANQVMWGMTCDVTIYKVLNIWVWITTIRGFVLKRQVRLFTLSKTAFRAAYILDIFYSLVLKFRRSAKSRG
jgi:hypothetical protein